ncbi:hypothetical protein DQV49_16065 (plasmid) [Staphylococcus aureus]|nr:hypothetical protein DQV49_16065 [Staphylococcus aureus]
MIILLSVFLIFNFVNSILFDNPFDFLESFIYSLVFTLIYLGLEVIKRRRNRLFFETSVNEFLLVLILYRNNSILYI